MHGGGRDSVHVRLTDMLGDNRDSELPDIHFLVICSRNESPSILNESDGVDRTEMLLVLLDDLFRVGIELQDLFV